MVSIKAQKVLCWNTEREYILLDMNFLQFALCFVVSLRIFSGFPPADRLSCHTTAPNQGWVKSGEVLSTPFHIHELPDIQIWLRSPLIALSWLLETDGCWTWVIFFPWLVKWPIKHCCCHLSKSPLTDYKYIKRIRVHQNSSCEGANSERGETARVETPFGK